MADTAHPAQSGVDRTDMTALQLSASYAEARARFLSLAQARDAKVTHHELPDLYGLEGERLSCDIAEFGNLGSGKVFIISSGLHGIEGFCGSGIQCQILSDDEIYKELSAAHVILAHAVNPYGFSHLRRVNEDNIDLNRNFGDFQQDQDVEAMQKKFRSRVFPDNWRGASLENIQKNVSAYIQEYGLRKYQERMTMGQYFRPDDPYYGGKSETWTRRMWGQFCEEISKSAPFIAHADIHTGLGPSAACELIYGGSPNKRLIELARHWLGEVNVATLGEGSSTKVSGAFVSHIEQYNIPCVGIGLEFGTVPLEQMLAALVADNWLEMNKPVDEQTTRRIRTEMLQCFMTDTPEWRMRVWQTARSNLRLMLNGLMRT